MGGGSAGSAGGGSKLSSSDRWELNGENLSLNGVRKAIIKSNGEICNSTGTPIATIKSDGDVVTIGRGTLGPT